MDQMAAAGTLGKSIMDGDFAPLYNSDVYREALETAGGWCAMVQATLSELDGEHHTSFTVGCDFGEAPESYEALQKQLLHLVIIVMECTQGISLVAANLYTAIEYQDVGTRTMNSSRLAVQYYLNLRAILSTYDMDSFFTVDELTTERATRFGRSLGKLIERTGPDDEHWPIPNGNLQAGEIPVPDQFIAMTGNPQYLFGERMCAAVVNVPPLGRLLTLKVAQILYPNNKAPISKYLIDAYGAQVHNPFVGARQSLSNYFMDATLKDGKDSNAQRAIRRVSYFAVLRMCQFMAIQQTLDEIRDTVPEELPGALAVRYGHQDYFPNVRDAKEVVDRFMDVTLHPVTQYWVYTPMGKDRQAPAKGADASHALHFLNAQMKDKQSMYQMPELNATQKSWDDWFQRVAALKTTYHELNDSVVIPMLLCHLGVDDKRIIGWNEASKEAFSRKEKKTLEQLIAHIKGLVVPTGTLRRDAMKQLLSTTGQPYKIADCQTLGSKIVLLFRSLFPPSTEEVEPMSKLTAMKHVHQMLYKIKYARLGDSSLMLVTAWVQYTSYLHAEMFSTYIDEQLHSSTSNTDRLCDEYINKVVKQLTEAHRMYIQMQSVMPRSHSLPPNNVNNRPGRSQHQVNAITGANGNRSGNGNGSDRQRSRSRPRSAGSGRGNPWNNPRERSNPPPQGPHPSNGGRGYGRSYETGRGAARGRGRSNGPGRGSRPPGPTGNEHPERPQYSGEEHYRRVEQGVDHATEVMQRHGNQYIPGNIRREMDPSLTRVVRGGGDQRLIVVRRISEGNCLLCQIEGHKANQCPHFAKASPEVQQKAREMRKAYFDGYYRDE